MQRGHATQRGRHHATRHVARRPGGDDAPLLKKYQDEIAALRREREELLAKAGAQPQVAGSLRVSWGCLFVCVRRVYARACDRRVRCGSPARLPICPIGVCSDGCLFACLFVGLHRLEIGGLISCCLLASGSL